VQFPDASSTDLPVVWELVGVDIAVSFGVAIRIPSVITEY
jgi:hypothetical protein